MNDDNADHYFEHSDQFHVALDLSGGRIGHRALARVMMLWIGHLLAIEVDIEPFTETRDATLTWYVGLDTEGTRIGDALWNGEEIGDALLSSVVGLYRLTFRDPSVANDKLNGEPVYLILAMGADKVLRLKPQNLVTGLPIKHLEAVT